MRDLLHHLGLIAAAIGAVVAAAAGNTPLAPSVLGGCVVCVVGGAALCAVTHERGEHGPRREG